MSAVAHPDALPTPTSAAEVAISPGALFHLSGVNFAWFAQVEFPGCFSYGWTMLASSAIIVDLCSMGRVMTGTANFSTCEWTVS
jgi:hypothetical protein